MLGLQETKISSTKFEKPNKTTTNTHHLNIRGGNTAKTVTAYNSVKENEAQLH